ncbi:hypothetical protein CFIMG_004033RAa [Ceratocystis fimbriata CBS 114723]|uniref:Uncharacterized protein n=1 Tax=Ceratocystis fimbriata CBS 114723 TaxID=1035309 RepID=A0A2C5X5P8_9PEZI|nr:hypothetical protein CFIMG_004033RAa [Ceratocystis fimbriata CBS 114723]
MVNYIYQLLVTPPRTDIKKRYLLLNPTKEETTAHYILKSDPKECSPWHVDMENIASPLLGKQGMAHDLPMYTGLTASSTNALS